MGKAAYVEKPGDFIWNRVLESGAAADSVLRFEAALNNRFSTDQKYAYEERLGKVVRQFGIANLSVYGDLLNGILQM